MAIIEAALADIVSPPQQDKPWGNEVLFASGEHGYVGKVITVLAGHALSLQYHERKDETLCLLSGTAVLEHGALADGLRSKLLVPGDAVHLPPLCIHRLTAVTDAVFVEVSTSEDGWRDDVTRLSDRYGRQGTSAP